MDTFTAKYDALMDLAVSGNCGEWKRRLGALLAEFGFGSWLFSLRGVNQAGDPLAGIITTFPDEWLQHYRKYNLLSVDPILAHSTQHLTPLCWCAERAAAHGRFAQFWSQRVDHGLECGFTVPLRIGQQAGSFNVSFDYTPPDAGEMRARAKLGQLLAVVPFLLEGFVRQSEMGVRPARNRLLTGRELECLHWAGVGKTSWEIGRILGCSERTVNFHVGNAVRKLNVSNRRQAVGVALAKGLILI